MLLIKLLIVTVKSSVNAFNAFNAFKLYIFETLKLWHINNTRLLFFFIYDFIGEFPK